MSVPLLERDTEDGGGLSRDHVDAGQLPCPSHLEEPFRGPATAEHNLDLPLQDKMYKKRKQAGTATWPSSGQA